MTDKGWARIVLPAAPMDDALAAIEQHIVDAEIHMARQQAQLHQAQTLIDRSTASLARAAARIAHYQHRRAQLLDAQATHEVDPGES